MKTFEKYISIVFGLFGIANIVASFFTNNYWQGIAGLWIIIAVGTFSRYCIVCPSGNCCQKEKEEKNND